jgi:hypothetical protein
VEIIITKDIECLLPLFTLMRADLSNENSVVNINFSNIGFLKPIVLTCLTQLVVYCVSKGISFTYAPPIEPSIVNHFNQLKWPQFLQSNYKQSQEIKPINAICALPLWRVSPEHMEGYVIHTSTYYKNLDEGKYINKDWTVFSLALQELLNNVYDHAESPTGAYTFSQYYPSRNNLENKRIIVVVADLGIGIINKVRTSNIEGTSPRMLLNQALQWAFEHGNSTQSKPHNRGAGLHNLLNVISSCKGKLCCYQGNQFSTYDGKKWKHKSLFAQFTGSMFTITFDPDYLQDFEPDDSHLVY